MAIGSSFEPNANYRQELPPERLRPSTRRGQGARPLCGYRRYVLTELATVARRVMRDQSSQSLFRSVLGPDSLTEGIADEGR